MIPHREISRLIKSTTALVALKSTWPKTEQVLEAKRLKKEMRESNKKRRSVMRLRMRIISQKKARIQILMSS